MIPQQLNVSSTLVVAGSLMVLLVSTSGHSSAPPKPTPRPGTLGAYARKITLDRSALGDPSGRVILTNGTVATIGDSAAFTLGAVATTGRSPSRTSDRSNSAERSRWRAAHQRQQRVVSELEQRRSLVETEIEHLEKGRLTPKILARLERAQSKRQHIEHEIARARQELARIVRDARRHGAEPGWFR